MSLLPSHTCMRGSAPCSAYSFPERATIRDSLLHDFPRAERECLAVPTRSTTAFEMHSSSASERGQRKFPAASSLIAAHALGNTYSLDQPSNIIFSARFEASRHISTINHEHSIHGRSTHCRFHWQLQARHTAPPCHSQTLRKRTRSAFELPSICAEQCASRKSNSIAG